MRQDIPKPSLKVFVIALRFKEFLEREDNGERTDIATAVLFLVLTYELRGEYELSQTVFYSLTFEARCVAQGLLR